MAIRKPLPVAAIVSRPLLAGDYFAMPATDERYELLEGMLLVVPPPSYRQQEVVLTIAVALRAFAHDHGGLVLIAPIGVRLDESTVFQPDAGYVSPERVAIVQENIEGAPDLVVEVLSPDTRRFDTGTKLRTYLNRGVLEVWLVDPVARVVHLHSPSVPVAVVAFGQPIPSTVVDIGDAGLGGPP